MLRGRSHLIIAAAAAILLSFITSTSPAFPNISGRTRLTGGTGCAGNGCHGGQTATITISGPSSLSVGQGGTYTLTFSGSSNTGANVAASGGTLAPVTTQFSLSGGELTFTSSRNSSTWQFTYTPASSGMKTIYAAGVVNGRPGTWNHAADFSVSVSATGVGNEEQPQAFALPQNYPNPFNPSTVIAFNIPAAGLTTLVVYDLEGRAVANLVDGMQSAGRHEATFNAAGLASGIYLARLTSNGESATRKLVLIR